MSDMEDAAFDRGRMHEKVVEHDRRLNAINGSIDRAEQALSKVDKKIDVLTGKLRVWAAMAAFIAGVVSPVVSSLIIIKLSK